MKSVIVIGGGAAGMLSASIAAREGKKVILFEKNNKLGKKLYITGKGRCNITNDCDVETLLENTPGNPSFLYSAFYSFDSYSTMDYFKSIGVPTKVERGSRVYPVSEKASDVVHAMENELRKNKVQIHLNTAVKEILIEDKKVIGVLTDKNEKFLSDSVLVCTGGLAYPMTGSTGDGYKFAKANGHTVTELYPSLVPLVAKEKWIKDLQGLSLKNVSILVKINGKPIYKDFGEMIFTHYGVSGPIILSCSRYVIGYTNQKATVTIDMKPALSEKELDTRLLRDFDKYINKDFKNALDDLLPQKIIPIVIMLAEIEPTKKVNELTKDERKRLGRTIKNIMITITDTIGYDEAVVTSGGINVDEIDPSTMESKLVKGLYFAGEVIDVDSYTGGFNLQIAFSTGYLAGINV